MAVDKLVDSAQLDTDLTAVANAIRAKGGTSASLAFPNGFVSAVEAIETGGGEELDDFSGGNILAIISHGTEYIDTDYLIPSQGIYVTKLADSNKTNYEHYWSAYATNKVIGLQRNNNSLNVLLPSGSVMASYPGYTTGGIITPAFAAGSDISTEYATKALLFFRGYYKGNIEAQIAAYTFYGLNIVGLDFAFIKKYRPWLEKGVPCIKEIVDGDIYYNNGSGTFGYIDLQGVTHSA